MGPADLWPPLAPLGDARGLEVERALGALPEAEVLACLDRIESSAPPPAGSAQGAALLAARFALAQRGGAEKARAEQLASAAAQAFARLGDGRCGAFLEVERAGLLASDKTRLGEAGVIADALPTPDADPALAAAVYRVRGAIARARADLRGSLLALEQSRAAAERSGSARELLRASNTLGTSYAALGVAGLAREALERARELSELSGNRQSAGIAAGQLAVLALDAGKPRLALRHLEVQRVTCERLGDQHGLARALSLSVEAHAACHEPGRAHQAGDASRALYARSPGPWTRLQAVMATLFEAEDALGAGDEDRAHALLASVEAERASPEPSLRVACARSAFVELWLAGRAPPGEPAETARGIERALGLLRRSPRPTWVERALLLAGQVARARGAAPLLAPLAVRASSLLELRGSVSTDALAHLRALAPEAAVARAMALGRDLVMRARLALAPFDPFEAELVIIDVGPEPGALDRAVAGFDLPASPGELPGSLLVSFEGHRRLLVAADADSADRGEAAARAAPGVTGVARARRLVRVTSDPSIPLSLSVAD